VLKNIWKHLSDHIMLIGYARAAAALSRQGYHEEAKELLFQKLDLENSMTK